MPTVAPLDLEGHVLAAHFLDETPFFVASSGEIHRLDMGHKTEAAHQGILATALDSATNSFLTGGEDGKINRISADGSVKLVAEAPRKWIMAVAAGPSGAVGFAHGKTATVVTSDGKARDFTEERTIEGLAFAPKGLRVALARYNGVTLQWVATNGAPVDLDWKGAHNQVTFSPDGRFLVTAMQENALHGWKLDGKPGEEARHMRMTGYPAKIKSTSWSVKGKWLASSGAPAAIVWPFSAKDGPMGKAPLELGTRANIMATSVAFHPNEEVLAIGYIDGMILGVRLADEKEALLRRPGKGAITSMSWSKSGKRLAFASEAGDCGVIDISA
ncbi:WD40 repeat domain-containing protein [Rhizobium alvei]|uniref:WD40 repeat domain-containing protein n=1 Tax=Rhizobium alvei TaxID=1132659 RepID=A0ABT8YQ15_9HYPH|nr:WD40 repeat domain-containing protein [Rhizobium alvei]MDO6965453.1 WD40 repeat domain-containing protein [Rhizobium alvei]